MIIRAFAFMEESTSNHHGWFKIRVLMEESTSAEVVPYSLPAFATSVRVNHYGWLKIRVLIRILGL